jgi:catechol 1,2-dioxygenase
MGVNRRQFLKWASAASGTAAAATLVSCDGDSKAGGSADATAPAPDADPNAPDADPSMCRTTTGDARGPFFEDGAPMRTKIADDNEPGERIDLSGQVLADDCTSPVAGALLDVWQADKDGGYHDAGTEYRLRGQVITDAQGRFMVETIKPGHYENGPGAWRPAHIHFTVTKPGYTPVTTQLYFAGDPYLSPNDGCPGCGSDDTDRIIALSGDAGTGWTGNWKVFLRRS